MKRALIITGLAGGLIAITSAVASAAWQSAGTGSGRAQAGSLSTPGAPTAPAPTATSGVTLSWSAATLTDGSLVKYVIERATVTGGVTGGYSAATAGTCASTNAAPMTPASATSPSCTDANTSAGSYKYRVTAAAGTQWRQIGGESAAIVVPTPVTTLTVTSLAIANGGVTSGKPEANDTIKVTFSGQIDTGSVCAGWTGATALTGVSVTMGAGNGQNANNLTVTGCTNALRFGSLSVNPKTPYHTTNSTPTWASSTLTWDSATNTLTLTLGGTQTPSTALTTPTTAPTWTYTPPASPNQITAPAPNTSVKATGTATQSTQSF